MASFAPADRLKGSNPSIWVEFTALAKECGALNIGQGFPDYASCPAYVQEALAKATVENPLMNQYTRGFGHPRLVNQLGKLYSSLLGRQVDPLKEVLVTVGAYQALFYAIFSFVNPGDEVILLEPYYDCYEPQTRMAGATPIGVPLTLKAMSDEKQWQMQRVEDPAAGPNPTSADLKLDFAELEARFSPKTKVLVLNNPHNPTGKLFTAEELGKIAALAEKHNVLVIADEVYEWITYKPGKMIRFASLPGMWERTITVGSAGKTFSVTGWKLGWAIAPRPLMQQLEFAHQNCVYTCPTTVQVAMCREAGLTPIVPEAGYFMMVDISAVKGKMGSFGDPSETDDYRFVKWLTREKKLAGIPPSAFYSPEHKSYGANWIRFCFFKTEKLLNEAREILLKTFK